MTADPADLAPTAPGAPLESLRETLIKGSTEARKARLASNTKDVQIKRLSEPGKYKVYGRFELPTVRHINRLQHAMDPKGRVNPKAITTVYVQAIMDLCQGVFFVADDYPDLELSIDMSVPQDEAHKEATWPDFKTGWKAIVDNMDLDPKKAYDPASTVLTVFYEGEVVGLVGHLVEEAGYTQGNS